MAATPVWLAPIEAMLNRNIANSTLARELAERLDGRSFALEIKGLLRLRMLARGRRLLLDTGDTIADVQISGQGIPLLRAALTDTDRPLEKSSVEITGDAEVARHFKELLRAARPDLAEELARLLGDIPAQRIARTAESAFEWAKRSVRTAGENLSEYLKEESRMLVNDTELAEFMHGVDRLRDAADRVEARLQLLERRRSGAK
jgi:ubiquinone biosynthesis protein UbiJ